MKTYDPKHLTLEDMEEIAEHGLKVAIETPNGRKTAGRIVEYSRDRHYTRLSILGRVCAVMAEKTHGRLFLLEGEMVDGRVEYAVACVERKDGELAVTDSIRSVEPLREPSDGVESGIGELKGALEDSLGIHRDVLPEREGFYYGARRKRVYRYSPYTGWTLAAGLVPGDDAPHLRDVPVSELRVRGDMPLEYTKLGLARPESEL
jgi:hypothetical protein